LHKRLQRTRIKKPLCRAPCMTDRMPASLVV